MNNWKNALERKTHRKWQTVQKAVNSAPRLCIALHGFDCQSEWRALWRGWSAVHQSVRALLVRHNKLNYMTRHLRLRLIFCCHRWPKKQWTIISCARDTWPDMTWTPIWHRPTHISLHGWRGALTATARDTPLDCLTAWLPRQTLLCSKHVAGLFNNPKRVAKGRRDPH